MQVDHGVARIVVAEQSLNDWQLGTIVEHVGGEAVASMPHAA
jgi:hypothetical protein